jgi:acetolactate synthase-1/2/3 large subunit
VAKIHGGQILARALKAEGVDTIFTLTGGHIVPLLDGCVLEGIRVVDVRHEQTAAHAAEAYTRLTGRIGVAAVTAGPGVTDTVTAIANAYYSATPMLVIGGRHMVRQELMGGLQEMDHPLLMQPITVWSGTAIETNRLSDYVATAVRHAYAGRGGPVFFDVPMDVQADLADEDEAAPRPHGRAHHLAAMSADTVAAVADRLAAAERPMIFAGGGLRGDGARRLPDLAEALQAPVFANGMARGAVPHGHPLQGNRTRSPAFAQTDLVLALGVDWDFRTGYGRKINPEATVIQVDADATKIGWNRPAHLGIVADPGEAVAALLASADAFRRSDIPAWTKQIMTAEEEALAAATASAGEGNPVPPQRFGRDVAEFFGPDAIVAVDGGDIVSTTARWLQVSTAGHVLDAGPLGTLGTGPGFALAAKVAYPDARVGIVFGDGGFGFNGMEYDTYVRHDLPIIGVVGNDGVWNNIKTFHQAFYPDRLVATDLGVRPYHAMVEGLGGHGEFVDDAAEVLPALHRAETSGRPALVNVHIAEESRMSSNYSQ